MCNVQRSFVFYKPLFQSLLLLSFCGCFVYFFSCDFAFWSGNHFWNKAFRTIEMAYIIFWLSFSCSLNHVVVTLFPSNQLFDRLRIHNWSLIDKFSMIYFGDHHGRFIAKILHLIVLIDNGNNCNNYIDIL